jgi:hypothetical protein
MDGFFLSQEISLTFDQGFLFSCTQAMLDLIFPFHGLAFCFKFFRIDQGTGAAASGIFGTFAAVMYFFSFFQIIGVAGVQRMVGTPQHITEEHDLSPLGHPAVMAGKINDLPVFTDLLQQLQPPADLVPIQIGKGIV